MKDEDLAALEDLAEDLQVIKALAGLQEPDPLPMFADVKWIGRSYVIEDVTMIFNKRQLNGSYLHAG